MPHYSDLILGKMTAAFASCPVCAAGGAFKLVGLEKNRVQCTTCKAEWDSPAFPRNLSKWVPQDAIQLQLTQLTLWKAGKNRELRVVEEKQKTVAWWQLLRSDAQGVAIVALVDGLLEDLGNPDRDQEVARQRLRDLSPLGREEVAGRQLVAQALLVATDEKLRAAGPAAVMSWFVKLGEDSLIGPVIDLLAHDPSAAVKANAAWALRMAGPNAAAIEALTLALDDHAAPPMEALMATSWVGLLAAAARSAPPASVSEAAAQALAEIDDPRAVVACELEHRSDLRESFIAIKTLGASALEPLLTGLESDNPRHRARAAGLIVLVPHARAVAPLLRLLSDEDPIARRNAAFVLGEIGDPRAVPPLTAIAQSGDDSVRTVAVEALAKLGAREVVSARP